MPTLQLLSKSQQKDFDSCPKFTVKQQRRYFVLNDEANDCLDKMRDTTNQVGFVVQLAYFRAAGKFFPSTNFRKKDIKYACNILGLEMPSNLGSYSDRCRLRHRTLILKHTGWQRFTNKHITELHAELLTHAKQQMQPKALLPIASNYLINRKIELPPYYIFAEIISTVYNDMEDTLVTVVEKSLAKWQKIILDDLIWFGDKRRKVYKYSALSKIKQFSYSTKIKNIEESIKNYQLLKTFNEEFTSVYQKLALPESATTYYSEWVSKSKLFQLKQFKNRSKAYLYLLAHLKHQYFRQTDLYIDMLIKLVGNANNALNKAMEKHTLQILHKQKKFFDLLSTAHTDHNLAFQEILSVLNDSKKDAAAKDHEIRLIIAMQLGSGHDKLTDNNDFLNLIDKTIGSKELKSKLLKTMGASLQRKLTPIICALDFEQSTSDSKTYKAIQQFSSTNGVITKDDIKNHLNEQELSLVNKLSKSNILVYKGILFSKIFNSIKSGGLSLCYSYNYLPMKQYLIDERKWRYAADTILESSGLATFLSCKNVLASLSERLNKKYAHINATYNSGDNKHLSFGKTGKFIISTPKAKIEQRKNKLAPIFAQEGIVPIASVLEHINNATNFVSCFKHHAVKKVIIKPTPETIFAGILSKGCNHGITRMANISKGINTNTLSNTINWFFSLENIQEANNSVVEYINKLSLPEIYKLNVIGSHTSSDGQKFNVGVDSILANYSFKYFGQSQGISVYSFIDDRQVLFYNTILSPGTREAAFVIDGLMANNVVKSHMHSTDTHGFSEVIFAVMHFLGVSFAPRIKKLGSQVLYCIDQSKSYRKSDYKIQPNKKINTKLIEDNWDDILRLIATIKTKTVTASQIFKRFNSYTKELPLYNGSTLRNTKTA